MRPAYKDHPLWIEAMALTHDAYALAEGTAASGDAVLAGRLRKAAVAVPARIASALDPVCGERDEEVLLASGAVAELLRQAALTAAAGRDELLARAGRLERALVFDLSTSESFS